MVIYQPAFDKILNARFTKNDIIDDFLGKTIPNKVVVYPFISRKKEFGNFDAIKGNEKKGQLSKSFDEADLRLKTYERIIKKYRLLP